MELLSQGTYTLQELSAEIHLSIKEVLHHLDHVRKSVRPPMKFIIDPAVCLKCGFVFKDRKKLHSPGRCPKCRDTHIQEPGYSINKGN